MWSRVVRCLVMLTLSLQAAQPMATAQLQGKLPLVVVWPRIIVRLLPVVHPCKRQWSLCGALCCSWVSRGSLMQRPFSTVSTRACRRLLPAAPAALGTFQIEHFRVGGNLWNYISEAARSWSLAPPRG